MMFVVIRIRGAVKARRDMKDTLVMLKLHRKNHCVLLNETDSIKGMLQKAKDYITWGAISDEMLQRLIEKRGRKLGDVRLSKGEAKNMFEQIKKSGKVSDIIKPVFRLTPPSGGFKNSIKQHYPRGELGNRKEKINELLEKMI